MKHIICIAMCKSLVKVLCSLPWMLYSKLSICACFKPVLYTCADLAFCKKAQSQGVFIVLNQEIQWLCA